MLSAFRSSLLLIFISITISSFSMTSPASKGERTILISLRSSTRERRIKEDDIISEVPAVDFALHINLNERARRIEEDDYILDDIVSVKPNVGFTLDANQANETNDLLAVCQIGCEGDYSEITSAITDLWDQEKKEYEFFFTVKGNYAVGAGVIYDNFYDRIIALNKSHPQVHTLILFDVPGSANDEINVKGSKLVYDLELSTCLPSDGHVSSGGTDLFVAGYNQYATPGAEIGIHSWEGDEGVVGTDVPRDDPGHDLYLDFYDYVCVPRDFYWETMSYGLPMHYISEEEINSKFPFMRDCDDECNIKGGNVTQLFELDSGTQKMNAYKMHSILGFIVGLILLNHLYSHNLSYAKEAYIIYIHVSDQ